jgi:DNA-binding NarL/FixJ family response regulator
VVTASGTRRTVRVLLVEDEVFVAMDAEAMLRSEGHEVVGVARTAEDAVAKAGRLSPELVLMDIRLIGRCDGIDAAEEIRVRFNLPVVFVTANVDPVTHARAMKVGPRGFISKPFTRESLLEAVSSAFDA